MKKELLMIENGSILLKGRRVFRSLYINLFCGDSLGMVFDDVHEKNILIRFLKGEIKLDNGRILFLNQQLNPEECQEALCKNIFIIERQSKLIRSLSLEENIFLCMPDIKTPFIGRHTYGRYVKRLREELGIDLKKFPAVTHLSNKDRILMEMVKAYAQGRKLLVFSIGGLLKSDELKDVHEMILRMRSLGMAFIVIDTLDDIINRWTDRFCVVKHGKTLGIYDSGKTDLDEVYRVLLQGDEKEKIPIMEKETEPEEWLPVLEFLNVTTDFLKGIDFQLGKGEVLKIFYTDDASCNHILEVLNGSQKVSEGRVLLEEKPYTVKNLYQAIRQGICFINEVPQEHMLMKNMNVFENISLLMGEKIPFFWMRGKYIRSVKEFLCQYMEEGVLDCKPSRIQPDYLQQMIYYKWMIYHPKVVVCVKPFTQEDIHAREVTVRMIGALRDRGIGVIILTSKFSDMYLTDGENLFVRDGKLIDENEVYQILYKKG